MSIRALFVVTGHTELGDTGEDTGWHVKEVSHPWKILRDAGVEVHFASPGGGATEPDPGSLDYEDQINSAFLNDPDVQERLRDTRAVADCDPEDYALVYFPGGHGTMWDFPDSEAIQSLTAKVWEQGGLVAAICHGPAALVNVKLDNGDWLVDSRTMTCFSDAEEREVDKDQVVPFLLQSRLEKRGAKVTPADNFDECLIEDGRLITGQNPASADALGRALVRKLREQQVRAA